VTEPATTPAWRRQTERESRLPVLLALLVAVALQALLPHPVLLGPRWALLVPEGVLLVALIIANPVRQERDTHVLRVVSLALTAVIVGANTASVVLLVRDLVRGSNDLGNSASTLLTSGGLVYLTNIVAFGLLYWELDRGGSVARARADKRYPDLLFPQMSTEGVSSPDWEPTIVDYVYVSFTNATAFSPTDTMPMTRWMKALFLVQSAVALVVVGLVVARAVNVLR
jgi:uncharacterized membrane protein